MTPYKILVTAPSWIGDMVMAQSLFKFLQGISPAVTIDVLAPAWTLPVVERMPEVRRGIPFPSRHGKLDLAMRIKTGLQFRAECYDEAIIIPRSLKSVIPSWVAGIRKRTAFKSHLGLINNPRKYQKSRGKLFVRRLLALATDDAYALDWQDIEKPALRIDEESRQQLLKDYRLSARTYVVFAPGAEFGPAKQWPAQYFAQLASLLNADGLQVVIMGSSREMDLAREIIGTTNSSNMLDLTGKTSLPDVIDLMSSAKSVVANDSGLMHLAYASGARVMAIYGSSSSKYTPPLSANATIFESKLDCQPCFSRTCPYGHYHCLQSITPQKVYEEICSDLA